MIFDEIKTGIAYYCVILVAYGTIGNLISTGICLRKSLREVPTFIFFAVISILDACSLYFINLNPYMVMFKGKSITDYSLVGCRLTSFLQMFFSQSSSYILVSSNVANIPIIINNNNFCKLIF